MFIDEMKASLETFNVNSNKRKEKQIGKIDFSNKADIERALIKSKDSFTEMGAINTGLIGLNKACGGLGIRRGDLVNIAGYTHHYKSGLLLDLSLNIPKFNTPWMWDNTKKPMIFRASFENSNEQDLRILYSKMYEMKYNKRCDLNDISISKTEYRLQPRYVLLKMEYRF
jgi:hypothetical protein